MNNQKEIKKLKEQLRKLEMNDDQAEFERLSQTYCQSSAWQQLAGLEGDELTIEMYPHTLTLRGDLKDTFIIGSRVIKAVFESEVKG